MFEDLWPQVGDYDFNDLVIDYRYTNTLNNRNKMTTMEWTFSIQALGATHHNGLALHLPNVPFTSIISSILSRNGVVISSDMVEPGHSDTHLILFEDLKNQIEATCPFFRAQASCLESISDTYTLTVVFADPVDMASIGQPPYDPYLFASDGQNHFVTQNNFPWVINIPGSWQHPLETVDILRAYPQFRNWVESSGTSNSDWYTHDNAVQEHLYGQ